MAQRLWRIEREHLIGQLWEVGVPVTGVGGGRAAWTRCCVT